MTEDKTQKFRIHDSSNVEISVHTVNVLCNPFEESDDKFLETIKQMIVIAKSEKESQYFGGGGLFELYVHPTGSIEILKTLMFLELEESKDVGKYEKNVI